MEKRRTSITVQYALHYFIVIAVTILLVFLLVGWVLQKHKNALVNNVDENVYKFMQELDASLLKQQNLAEKIFLDKVTAPGNIESHPLQTLKGIEKLELYQSAVLLNDYLFLKYPGYDELILYNGTMSLESFMKYELQLEERSKEAMKSMLENYSVSESGVFMGQNSRNIFVWSYPFQNNFTGKKGIISFGIRGDTLESYLHDKVRDMPFYAILTDDAGHTLFEINELTGISEERIRYIREKMLDGEEIPVKGYTADVYDSVNGFTFCMILDDNYVLSDFRHIVTLVLCWGTIIFGLVIILIFFVNNVHIKQIKQVRDDLFRLQTQEGKLGTNEFSQIHDLIEILYQEQRWKAQERHYLDQTMAEMIARLLFSGKLEQREDMLRELVALFCPRLRNKYYTVFCVVSGEDCQALAKNLTADSSVIVCREEQDILSNLLYLVVGLPDADAEGKHRRALAGKLLDEISGQGNHSLFVVSGRVYEHLHEVSASYQEVLMLINILLDDSSAVTGRAFVFEEMLEERIRNAMSEDEKLSFAKALKEGISEKINEAITLLFDKVLGEESGQSGEDFGAYVLAELFTELFEENGCEEKKLIRLQEMDFEDMETMKQHVMKLAAGMKVDNSMSARAILDYINENYKDNTMGLDTLAAQFHMSVSGLSRRIKDSVGENYSDYIFRIRIEEACRLLRETQISVRDIPAEVGYSDYSSFSRKFKSKMGVTLKEYRDNS